jgi:hypothetical protein
MLDFERCPSQDTLLEEPIAAGSPNVPQGVRVTASVEKSSRGTSQIIMVERTATG